ncbi:PREDICTED: glutathione S-transferase C-terminal domain-containing protein-like [Ficedula albicollis]|uniref:glutathione S-transferase C-terminal domain-containing protein-like n=1 Tax=Ficedula albicollis TaxID=59894 RepID=UPI0007AD8D9E|nr:PREDICTED: glutathione S-transferase C-terminal domain-containing protein-like [Ficedula albicollis]
MVTLCNLLFNAKSKMNSDQLAQDFSSWILKISKDRNAKILLDTSTTVFTFALFNVYSETYKVYKCLGIILLPSHGLAQGRGSGAPVFPSLGTIASLRALPDTQGSPCSGGKSAQSLSASSQSPPFPPHIFPILSSSSQAPSSPQNRPLVSHRRRGGGEGEGKGEGGSSVPRGPPGSRSPVVPATFSLSADPSEAQELNLRKKMKENVAEEHLYLAFSHQYRDSIFPLHTSISLFLLSYCDCKLFKVFLVPTGEDVGDQCVTKNLAGDLEVHLISRCQLPVVVQSCSLPAVVVKDDKFCRAGLSVVLRHIIQKTFEADPSKKDVLALLGFKKTCLKACAEVSQWTRLCEISIPLAVERFLTASPEHCQAIPPDILLFERKLGEPVRVHNDDKIRRQKLQQQKAGTKTGVPVLGEEAAEELKPGEVPEHPPSSLELSVAFSKLLAQEAPDAINREAPHIRRTKTSDLPLLDHVFAEGLYFTVADLVLLPCIHQFLVSSKKQGKNLVNLPLISSWYRRVQEVPGVKKAAGKCNMALLQLPELTSAPEEQLHDSASVPDELEEDNEDSHFIGGPRPTMTKLMENGIEAKFSPHPCPNWTLDWTSLPSAVSPGEGECLYVCLCI